MIIYKATNKINGKVYIGQTSKTLEQRKRGHEDHALSAKRKKGYFQEALLKYGFDNFIWEIIDEATTQEELDDLEISYIAKYHSTNPENGYNLKKGGRDGGLYNEECRRRLGESTKKKWADPEIAQKMLNGLRKGSQTVKERAKHFWVVKICPTCRKEFKTKPNYKTKYCSYACACIGNQKISIEHLKIADNINSINFEKERKRRCAKLFDWVRKNKETIMHAKLNKLTFIKDIDEYIGVTDDRTTSKIVGCLYRRDFIRFLQKCVKIINMKSDSGCSKCGCETIRNNGYLICPTCGYSKCG